MITAEDQKADRPDGYAVDIVIYPLYAGVDADGGTTLLRGESKVWRTAEVSCVSAGACEDPLFWLNLRRAAERILESALAALLKRRSA